MIDRDNLKCPFCQSVELEHRDYKGTHAYVCPSCAFIGFEYYEKKDISGLEMIINMEEIEAQNWCPSRALMHLIESE